MLAIFIVGESRPILVKRFVCNIKRGLQFEDENGKMLDIIASTIKNVVFNYDAETLQQ